MSKAVAVQTIFLIGVISIIVLFVVALLFQWADTTNIGVSKASYTAKKISYCSSILNNRNPPFDWNTKAPHGCEEFDITEPKYKNDCV
ncbi:MAG: hypothetical protein IH934_06150 [Nanoarchaeota archaeon]|nr:hypothetical protein [Nanoarchaeota archaeon]